MQAIITATNKKQKDSVLNSTALSTRSPGRTNAHAFMGLQNMQQMCFQHLEITGDASLRHGDGYTTPHKARLDRKPGPSRRVQLRTGGTDRNASLAQNGHHANGGFSK